MIGWSMLVLLALLILAGMVAVTTSVTGSIKSGFASVCVILAGVAFLYTAVYGIAFLIKRGI